MIRSSRGFSLTEMVVAMAVGLMLMLGVLYTEQSSSDAFYTEQQLNAVRLVGQKAIQRIVQLTRTAVTTKLPGPDGIEGTSDDVSQFLIYDKPGGTQNPISSSPATGTCLTFRESVDLGTGAPVNNSTATTPASTATFHCWICGPDSSANPPTAAATWAQGIVHIHAVNVSDFTTTLNCAGVNGFFGTYADNTVATASDGQPYVELLVPSQYQPSSGCMFLVQQSSTDSRSITFTLRLNAQRQNVQVSSQLSTPNVQFGGGAKAFVLPNDLVLTATVELFQ
jgi:prepilin-type N-terminal cleavage/methylation domain-containing protein